MYAPRTSHQFKSESEWGTKKFQQQHRQPENTLPKITLVRFQNENEDLNKYESVSNKKSGGQ